MDDMERVVNALKQCISEYSTCKECPYEGTTCTTTLNTDVLNLLKGVAPVKHGHWIKNIGTYKCSECGEILCCYGDYCLNCGAKMDEASE